MASHHDPPKTVIAIGGPTAGGKTALAIELALHFKTEIISADSRQCYRELCIGVARPSLTELAAVPHHFIASHAITEDVSVATFEAYAIEKATEIFSRNDVLILVGGTGLYINAFCNGLDAMPPIPEAIRAHLRQQLTEGGLEALQQQVQREDPLFYALGEMQNPHRVLRALEVIRATGKSIKLYQTKVEKKRPFQTIYIGVDVAKEVLHQRIAHRVDSMMEQGLLDEVASLQPYSHLKALQTVGYRELFLYLEGKLTLQKAVEDIKTATRQYAKRQLTWFRKEDHWLWFQPQNKEAILESVSAFRHSSTTP